MPDLPTLLQAIRDATVDLDRVRHDPRAGAARIPFSRRLPRRMEGEIVVWGARSVAIEGRAQQSTDSPRDIRWDGKARRLVLECLLARIVVETDAPAAEVRERCTEAEGPRLADTDLPEAFRREMDGKATERLRRQEGWSARDRRRHGTLSVLGGVAALLLALVFREPWWAILLAVAAGAGAGFAIARKEWDFAGAGAAAFGAPQMALTCTGEMFREMVHSSGFVGLLVFPLWLMAVVFGGVLARMNGRLLETQEVEAGP